MTRKLARLACLTLLLVAPAVAQESEAVTGPAQAIDADIVMVNHQRVILYGVDAPERSQTCFMGTKRWDCWDAAMSALGNILAPGSATCTLTAGKPDPFGRRFGVCQVEGKDVGAELVRQGMAMALVEQADDYVSVEQEARAAEVGLWQPGVKVDAPWIWRKLHPGGFR